VSVLDGISPGILRAIIVVATIILIQWPLLWIAIMWTTVVWLVPRMYRDRTEVVRLRAADQVLRDRAEQLEAALGHAREKIDGLRQELEIHAANRVSQGTDNQGHPAFRKVGLDKGCPRWVAEVVRREYRKRLHPDGQPAGRKAEAERRFKEAEGVFAEIWKLRGF